MSSDYTRSCRSQVRRHKQMTRKKWNVKVEACQHCQRRVPCSQGRVRIETLLPLMHAHGQEMDNAGETSLELKKKTKQTVEDYYVLKVCKSQKKKHSQRPLQHCGLQGSHALENKHGCLFMASTSEMYAFAF